jgi:hypothetical protein
MAEPLIATADLHAHLYDLVAGRPPGHWMISQLTAEARRAHPQCGEREIRFAIWDCINGGALQLQREPQTGRSLPRLELGEEGLDRARACARFRELVEEQRLHGGTDLDELVPKATSRAKREPRHGLRDIRGL